MEMQHVDLFSGIGGAAFAVDTVWPGSKHTFVEIDKFCQAVLKKNFPNSQIYGDIRTFTANPDGTRGHARANENEAERRQQSSLSFSHGCDLLTGGFPCQPFSQAGRRKGTSDDRHLWPEMLRVIREFRPRWIVGENVAGLLSIDGGMVFESVCADLEGEGYAVQAFVIPAAAVNAPHRRDRVWIVAHADGGECNRTERRGADEEVKKAVGFWPNDDTPGQSTGTDERIPQDGIAHGHVIALADAERERSSKRQGKISLADETPHAGDGSDRWQRHWSEAAARFCGVDDGLSAKLDGLEFSPSRHRVERLKALGNAWVPQVAIEIMRGIKQIESRQ